MKDQRPGGASEHQQDHVAPTEASTRGALADLQAMHGANYGVVVCCSRCGTRQTTHWIQSTNDELVRLRRCFNCCFWEEKVNWAKAGDVTPNGYPVVRAGGEHFVFRRISDQPRFLLGFGGRTFTAKLLSGVEIVSNDVWHQGAIPEHFRTDLPDNATLEM